MNYVCPKCHKKRSKSSLSSKPCFRCKLHGAFLLQMFTGIVNQPDMQNFKDEIEGWYPNGDEECEARHHPLGPS